MSYEGKVLLMQQSNCTNVIPAEADIQWRSGHTIVSSDWIPGQAICSNMQAIEFIEQRKHHEENAGL
ncbi:hypothetical protein EBAPG3_011635 [Nitrosospira lacus]|uniref:Uncharacterized protein n=1 Tax=Nitrosospira lacus TaxID=1288494 RepID=A0A1W6SRD9_9PROT|nr:hypothetical protein EBAPG3_011635 [Nitrosospira lacus]